MLLAVVVKALLLGFLCCLQQQTLASHDTEFADLENSTCDHFVNVAIVGAGASGMYSAYKLRNSALTVELIDASNRYGGRTLTAKMASIPDIPLDLGVMMFIKDRDKRVEGLVRELGLTTSNMDIHHNGTRFFLRGKSLTTEDVERGDLPFNLTPEEKANQGNLAMFYLQKLTGLNESCLREDQAMRLRLVDGRPLYKPTIHEALDLVASPEGKELLKALCCLDGIFAEDASAINFFYSALESNRSMLTLKDGMESLITAMAAKFFDASNRHKLNLNKKLENIRVKDDGVHVLKLRETITRPDGYTVVAKAVERVCANTVILAVSQMALAGIDWRPLSSGKVLDAISAVRPIPESKVYLTFDKPWWLSEASSNTTTSIVTDAPFNRMMDMKSSNVSGQFVMMASYADMHKTAFLKKLNHEGKPIAGSPSSIYQVSTGLTQELLTHLAEAFDVDRKKVPEPKSGVSRFWLSGYTVWKAGYHPDDVRMTIQRPSLTEDVFIVGPDFGLSPAGVWMESALATVDEVFDKYFDEMQN